MVRSIYFWAGLTMCTSAIALTSLPSTIAQTAPQEPQPAQGTPRRQTQSRNFQGRGVARGAAFTMGRTAEVTLTLEGGNFSLEINEPAPQRGQSGTRGRVQYRGAIVREGNDSRNPNSFTLDTRVRSFDSSTSLRIVTNTTGTCRIEVFDARVVSSNCRSAATDSNTQFLGLEQF